MAARALTQIKSRGTGRLELMTSLYRLDCDSAAIARAFGAARGEDPWAGGHVSPGQFAPIITGGREFIAGPRGQPAPARITPRLWGVPPPPKADDPRRIITSVRNYDSPFWIGNLRNSEFRCLVPATSFMEWGSGIDVEGRRNRHWFAPASGALFALAAIWKDSEIPGFALLTCPANDALRRIGCERMPVIVPAVQEAYQAWLYADWKRAQSALVPYPAAMMREVETPGS